MGAIYGCGGVSIIRHIRSPNIEITAIVFCTLATFWLAENVVHVLVCLVLLFLEQTARTSVLAMDEHTHLVQATHSE